MDECETINEYEITLKITTVSIKKVTVSAETEELAEEMLEDIDFYSINSESSDEDYEILEIRTN